MRIASISGKVCRSFLSSVEGLYSTLYKPLGARDRRDGVRCGLVRLYPGALFGVADLRQVPASSSRVDAALQVERDRYFLRAVCLSRHCSSLFDSTGAPTRRFATFLLSPPIRTTLRRTPLPSR